MCVIICCDKESGFPALATLESAEALNRHGGGVAWLASNGKILFKKGINAKQIFEMTKTMPLPAIIHFRIASIGDVNDPLCHPFPINAEASCELDGECDSVLFHNGTWSNWTDVCLNATINKGIEFPEGDWSDSRAMAWLVDKYGTGIMNLIPDGNKIAILSKDGIKKYGKWTTVQEFSCSNDYFDHSKVPAFEFNFGKKSLFVDDEEFFHTIPTQDDPLVEQKQVKSHKKSRKHKANEKAIIKEIKRLKKRQKQLMNMQKETNKGTTTKLIKRDGKTFQVKEYPTGILSGYLSDERRIEELNKLAVRNDDQIKKLKERDQREYDYNRYDPYY